MNLNEAVAQFDAVAANLVRLQNIWAEMKDLIPSGIAFVENGTEGQRYQDLARAYEAMIQGLPPIGEISIQSIPWRINEIAQARFDLIDIDEPDAIVAVEDAIEAPTREIAEYRFRFNQARAKLVRERTAQLIREVDLLLVGLVERVERDSEPVVDEDWDKLRTNLKEIERLAGSHMSREGYGSLFRHLHWAQGIDLHDIATTDWPPVRAALEVALYSELEPLPVQVDNLATLVDSKPVGPVTTELRWNILDDDGFERLVFNLASAADDYRNVRWLMKTNAADKGRDISADRLVNDSLSGTRFQRVIIQVRHWLTNSLRPQDISDVVAKVSLWEPPLVHVLIMVTSGWLTADAVRWIENHNSKGSLPAIEMWPQSHVELLLSARPDLVATFNLRRTERAK